MFYENLLKLCSSHGVKVTNVVTELRCSQGSMSHWKKGGTPNAATLKKFADYFDVSTDDLINGAKIPNTHKYEDEQLLAAYEQADDNIKAAIRQLLKL